MADQVAPAPEAPKAAPVEAPNDAQKEVAQPVADAPAETSEQADARTYKQDELDRIIAKVKKNERYRTKKEVEAFYQGRESAAPKPPATPPPAEDKPPTRDQFDTYEGFLDAKAEYTGRRAAKEQRQKDDAEHRQRQAHEAHAKRLTDFQGKVAAKFPDLHERAEAIAHIQMPPGMGESISESELGPDILDHFVSNPKDFERIAALSPSAAIREVGKLEARLEAKAAPAGAPSAAGAAPEAKKPSAAPAPIRPVAGSPAATGDDLDKLVNNPQAWKEARERQLRAKRAGGER